MKPARIKTSRLHAGIKAVLRAGIGAALLALVPFAQADCGAGTVVAGVSVSTPNSDFAEGVQGTVVHVKTGLIWKRCVEGQNWNGSACIGEPLNLIWQQALQHAAAVGEYAGGTGWRVPNRKELESIVEFCGYAPAINQFQFPPSPAEMFWSSTTVVGSPDSAWNVQLSDGYSGLSRKSSTLSAVRLVRTAAPGSLLTPQLITFGTLPNVPVGGSATLTASSSAGLPVQLATHMPEVCSVSGFTVQGIREGSCLIVANQPGSETVYPAAPTSVVLNIGRINQSVSLSGAASVLVGASMTVTATASSGLPVTLSTTSPGVCSLTGGTLTGLVVGTCLVTATQAGDGNYHPAPTAHLGVPVGPAGGDEGEPDPTPAFSYGRDLAVGWHLLGNSLSIPIDVLARFNDPAKVESVWKWLPDRGAWAFHSPLLSATQLQDYLDAKSFQPLTEIEAGGAFWIRMKQSHDFGAETGAAFTLLPSMLKPGWNLVTTGEETTPEALNIALAATPPSAGEVPQSFVSLWAWDSVRSRWYFYAPALEAQGPTKVKDYTDSRAYLDFATEQKKIGKGAGFWIRK